LVTQNKALKGENHHSREEKPRTGDEHPCRDIGLGQLQLSIAYFQDRKRTTPEDTSENRHECHQVFVRPNAVLYQ
jgi:hypothetical protein